MNTDIIDGFYFDNTANMFKKCHPNCKKCTSKGNDTNNLCDECIDTLIKQKYTTSSSELIKIVLFIVKMSISI